MTLLYYRVLYVSIDPKWNIKASSRSSQVKFRIVSIDPKWNVKDRPPAPRHLGGGFNRSKVECKGIKRLLLIMTMPRFNRSKMECKAKFKRRRRSNVACFNRSKVECKVISGIGKSGSRIVSIDPKWNVKQLIVTKF